jgi:glutamine amidotransferase
MIHPIVDEFYSTNPAHMRSAGFAQAKGQTITGPDKRVLEQPVARSGGAGESAPSTPEGTPSEIVNEAVRRLRVE